MSENNVNQVAQTLIEKQVLTVSNGVVKTTSLQIADYFEKQHKNVLRDIQSLDCSKEFNRLNFELVKYTDEKGELRPMYELTKDGFVFLVMGYRGEKAALFKEAYIQAFNLMQDKLFENLKQELLTARPLWQKICRYRPVLTDEEIAKLLDISLFQLQHHLNQMERCGLFSLKNELQHFELETLQIENNSCTDPKALWRLNFLIKQALFFPKASRERTTMIKKIASSAKLSVTTIYRYIEQYEQSGLQGLQRKRRSDRGKPRSKQTKIITANLP